MNNGAINIHVKAFGGHMCLFALGKYLGARFLDHIACMRLTLWKTVPFYTLTQAVYESSRCLTSLPILALSSVW